MQTADVVIIGGGIVGASIAYHLTAAGQKNVLILERESHQGKGSTGKSMGGVRAQFSTTVNIQMSLYSIPFYSSFEERLGHPSGYKSQGYLFLATNQAHLDYLSANQKLQKSLGLKNVAMLTAEELRKMFVGYSDLVTVYLNGRPIYSGNNALSFREESHLGLVNADSDAVFLPVEKGDNELVLAVTEFFGGWAFMCRWAHP